MHGIWIEASRWYYLLYSSVSRFLGFLEFHYATGEFELAKEFLDQIIKGIFLYF
jgi:hypothetical protein